MSIRIRGLVRAFRIARDRLRRGIAEEEREEFRETVRRVVGEVEEICAAHFTRPAALPAPSRKAYEFLKGLDLRNLPRPRPGTEAAPPIRVPGVVACADWASDYLWERHEEILEGGPARRHLLRELRTSVAAVEDVCEMEGSSPRGLPIRSRRAWAWMRFLGDGANLDLHAECLQTVRRLLPATDGLEAHLANTSKLWQVRRRDGRVVLLVSEGFLPAPPGIWRDLAGLVHGDLPSDSRTRIREFSETEEFASVLVEMESAVAPPGSERGLHHDLGASFDRVNAACFGGRAERPRLVWNEVPTVAKFGHYVPCRDTVMVALVLDDPEVPAFVVDFVVYHELLHREIGAESRNGRRHVHTPEFRSRERRFDRHVEADRFLDALAKRLR